MTNKNIKSSLLLLLALSVASCCASEKSQPAMYSVSADEISKSESGPHTLPLVYFALNESKLSDEALGLLDGTIIPEAKSPHTDKVVIEAHCDERGTAEYNQKLSEERAGAVKDYLIAHGIPAEKIKAVGYGKTKPIALGHDEASWAKNRRAVTIVIKE